jgi:putative membrane protein
LVYSDYGVPFGSDARAGWFDVVRFLIRMSITALGVLVVAYLGLITLTGFGPGVALTWSAFGTAFLFAIVLGIVNAVVKPIVKVLTLPISIVTLGIFSLLINLAMFYLAAAIIPGIKMDSGFWLTAAAAIIVAVFNGVANGLTKRDERR